MIIPLLAAVTFHADIEPLLQRHCQSCHRPGEIGRMPLLTYEQTRPWAKAIRQSVMLRKMPPWFAEKGGPFLHEARLSDEEVRVFSDWAATGAPKGRSERAPPPKQWTRGWNIPTPDLTLTAPKPFSVPAEGEVDYQLLILPTTLSGDQWVSAVEIRPSARDAVHHIVAYIREPGDDWLRGKPKGEYFPTEQVTRADILAVYTPGQAPFIAREGMAKKLPAGAEVVLEVHYTPSGQPRQDRTQVGLVLSKAPPRLRVLSLQMNQTSFLIPPREANHRVSVSGTLPNEALLLAMFPHMHLRGKAFEYAVAGTQGRFEVLLRVAPYNFFWQLRYELAEPRRLKAGTRLVFTAWYDNSANNPRNPDPGAEVRYGLQSREEMMVGFFDVAVSPDVDKRAFFVR